ncbi:Eco29kI family restriction endonuclease [Corynebacterium accolens]|jgi:ngoMIIIM protein|uniref:Eco29kI family restriction endonuclease n=1 Tax=Corynebacterium accolens TaxID=38284 RepID=UPI002542DA2F|nr:Eco29kI family restriction endonuclease [Corynebacterium accolens]MDK4233673.1 Eco29kI family restriction endonuclease [Corynebacterium accolens]MDK8470152.1 Eco29kI family restriction endonuclease [Corynebacterium accolens]MDK8675319.1 Eco29kI family restriction endonuclease [Corynebacterium accolens]
MSDVFDPLSYENLGASIARALEEQPLELLDELPKFDGAGIYALYYSGFFEPYRPLAEINRKTPGTWAIYIGKAEADATRKGDPTTAPSEVGAKLWKRLQNHKKSITAAENIDVRDFFVRRLVVSPTWVPLAESIALRLHHPVWNTVLDGLGNHDPGKGRYAGMKPRWDHLHPGRSWASKLQEPRPETQQELAAEVLAYLNRGKD